MIPFHTEEDFARAAPVVGAHLARGGLLGYPTETVYGLGSDAAEGPLAALAALKGRPTGKPFLLLVSGRAMAERYGLRFHPAANALATAFWPGPLTLVLPGGEGKLPDRLRGAEGGIAVRHTSHRGMAFLVGAIDRAITSTSANLPGGPPAPGADRVESLFRAAVDQGSLLVLDGGVLGNVPPSSVIDCTREMPSMVREGAIPRTELRRTVGRWAP